MFLVLDVYLLGVSMYFFCEGFIVVLLMCEFLSEGWFGDFEEMLLYEICYVFDSVDWNDGDIFNVFRQ